MRAECPRQREAERWHPDRLRPLYAEFFRSVHVPAGSTARSGVANSERGGKQNALQPLCALETTSLARTPSQVSCVFRSLLAVFPRVIRQLPVGSQLPVAGTWNFDPTTDDVRGRSFAAAGKTRG